MLIAIEADNKSALDGDAVILDMFYTGDQITVFILDFIALGETMRC
jgi:hypothetical protein